MKWKHPPVIKIYEALGSIADDRIELNGDVAKVYSSSGNKFYDVSYDPEGNAIMTNDNGSYWKGYLGYPAIAYLLKTGILSYNPELAEPLKGVAWKDINQKFENDFDKTLEYILSGINPEITSELQLYVKSLDESIKKLGLNLLGKKTFPPKGY
ncbi:MAG: hypothetical protein Q8P21_01900 [bacterium]|nr:hypothetical protein [bacterium]